VTLLWCEEKGNVVTFNDLAPSYGTPPGSPLLRLGPGLSGTLSGLIMEEDGRQQLRLRLGQPPDDEEAPWDAPLPCSPASVSNPPECWRCATRSWPRRCCVRSAMPCSGSRTDRPGRGGRRLPGAACSRSHRVAGPSTQNP